MNSAHEYYHIEPTLGIELVPLPHEFMHLGFTTATTPAVPPLSRSALKSTSLSRMEELHVHLQQCDQPSYSKCYFKLLKSCPSEVVEEFANQLRTRSQLLAYEEQLEYKRGKALNVLGGAPVPMASVDVDAFCNNVLGDDVQQPPASESDGKRKREDSEEGSELENAQPTAALATGQLVPLETPRAAVETHGGECDATTPPEVDDKPTTRSSRGTMTAAAKRKRT